MKYYSQNDEQAFIIKYFGLWSVGTYVDVGAYDGVTGSNTASLQDIGWTGVCVEPCHNSYELLVKNRRVGNDSRAPQCFNVACIGDSSKTVELLEFSGIPQFNAIVPDGDKIRHEIESTGASGELSVNVVNAMKLDRVLDLSILSGSHIDFVSIDVEGYEIEVLKGFDLKRWKPKLMCIEHNDPRLGNRLCSYLSDFDYHQIHSNDVNTFFEYYA